MTTMQRVRGLVPVVALVLLAGGALAGCRSQPTVAAYVGSDEITEKRVTDIIDDFNGQTATPAAPASPGEPTPAPPAISRTDVVSTLVLQQVCDQLKAEKQFKTTPVSAADIAQREGLPPASDFAKARADLLSCLSGVEPSSGTPTEKELRDFFGRAVAAHAIDPGTPFESFMQQLSGDESLQQSVSQSLAANRAFTEAAQHTKVSVNPRYRPLEFPIYRLQTGGVLVAVPLGEDALDAVTPAP